MKLAKFSFVLSVLTAAALSARGDLVLFEAGKPVSPILFEAGATEPERAAAEDLAATLRQITGANFAAEQLTGDPPEQAIFVGSGPRARQLFGQVPWGELGPEEAVIVGQGKRLLLSGGRPRGTLYAVSRFLQDQCGVRWWTPWASRIPKRSELHFPELNVRAQPAFEYREPFWFVGFDAKWAVRNCANGQSAKITESLGGSIRYKGFVHTFYPLVPPDKHFAEHSEWFSMIGGQRSTNRAQLCLTNPQLRDFVVGRVKQWCRESPEARIVSVSQNDWYGACECPDCKAIDTAEGSHSGTMLSFVNHIAEKIESEFPNVAVDTLAYQYTRKPPKTLRPRTNVIVRLCSIECNFREPLDHPSNSSFADDIRGWSKVCQRLYVWDYTTDFAHYVQPHPNWFVLGQNLRFFQAHHVRGVFEQGAYQSYGSEMAEMRAWVLAQLLWNPQQDDRALRNEFLDGYYGSAAPLIRSYLELMHEASRDYKLTCFSPVDAPFFKFETLAKAESLWRSAESAVKEDPELFPRVQLGHLPLMYVWLARWNRLHDDCTAAQQTWPFTGSKQEIAEQWLSMTQGQPNLPWTKITLVNESGVKPEEFLRKRVLGTR